MPAENDPENYHSVTSQNSISSPLDSCVVVGDTLCNLAENDKSVVAVCAAMTRANGLDEFKQRFSDRFFDVGIAEEHAVTFAAGLAKGGSKPFVAIYSTFLQRSYDQILHDVALQNLPVTFLIDRAGFVGSDGKTHQGLFDLSYLGNIPNLKIWTPSTYLELSQMITASVSELGPVAIRYSKNLSDAKRNFTGTWNVVKQTDKGKITVLAVGSRMVELALQAVADIDIEVVDVTTVKPLDDAFLYSTEKAVITLEENVISGGFGQSVARWLTSTKKRNTLKILGVEDKFVSHATISEQMSDNNFNITFIRQVINDMLANT